MPAKFITMPVVGSAKAVVTKGSFHPLVNVSVHKRGNILYEIAIQIVMYSNA